MDHSEVKHLPKVDHTPAELDEASKLLLKAADLIEKRGLCKTGNFTDKDGRICFQCALNRAQGIENDFDIGEPDAIWREANNRMGKALHGEFPFLWIERPEISTERAVAKLRAVALSA